ncbi:MAG: hypothetical protein KBG27_02315 [Flexilinea sp.]|jgi:ADP-dependent phosphofructokinase/glucokinase|nr:hypothetical protein [Flexilinea sp.]HQF80908.1 ADP-dependent glucokinase/phosphofructokinase [Flexilinea sp.]
MTKDIVLGLGNNIDYEIEWDSAIFENLVHEFGIEYSEIHPVGEVQTQRDLIISILSYMKEGKGGECFVRSSQIIEDFSKAFRKKITLGGTSVRAAIAMSKIGYSSALHLVTMNDDVRRLLPPDCEYICSAPEENSYPHLIIQFTQNHTIRVQDKIIRPKQANRIIYDNDLDNILMRLDPRLSQLLLNAKVFLISGFNAMQDQSLLEDRLEKLLISMKNLPKDALIFYEDACFYNKNFSRIVRDKLLGHIQIFSLNEDEFEGYIGRKINLLDPLEVLQSLEVLCKLIPVPKIVLHTQYWALAYGRDADSLKKALKGGITMGGTRYRFGDDFTRQNYFEMEKSAPQKEGAQFSDRINAMKQGEICCLPCVEVNDKNVTTIGLGDAFVGGFLPALVH